MKVHPTFGNLVIEEDVHAVALLLRTDHDGRARFTYREIALLADKLSAISRNKTAVVSPADYEDLLG